MNIPGTEIDDKIGKQMGDGMKWLLGVRNVKETEDGLRRDRMIQQGLKTWSYRLGGMAIGACILALVAKAAILVAIAATVVGAWGCVKGAQYLVKKDMEHKAAAREALLAQEQAAQEPEPAPAPKVQPVAKTFTAAATNEAAPRPAVLTQPGAGFLKKMGIGK
ncbi:MAG: hypothetical protein ACAH80_11960 [Alphaproteobacteria bacterium]